MSQCLYSGSNIMNYAPTFGWYYNSLNDRAPAWTSVQFLYNFLTKNKGVGPFGIDSDKDSLQIGDIVQMQIEQPIYQHTAIIDGIKDGLIFISAHTYDSKNRLLSTYAYKKIRYIHISGVRKWE